MILQALHDFNLRNPDKSPDGWIDHVVDYLVLLDPSGGYRGLRNLRDRDEKTKREVGKTFLVPNIGKQVFKHTNAGNDPNLLWDNASFALGIGKNGDKKLQFFREELNRWLPESVAGSLAPLDVFLSRLMVEEGLRDQILSDRSAGKELLSGLANVSFALDGQAGAWLEDPIVTAEFDRNFANLAGQEAAVGCCLITGEESVRIASHHPVLKGMRSDKDPNFISFNDPAYRSYGKEKGLNAPCSQAAVRGYSAALNNLLRDGSGHALRFGKLTTLFWSESADPFEDAFAILMGFSKPQDPGHGIGELRQALEALFSGQFCAEGNRQFFVLGIEAMGPRLAVRSWKRGTVKEVATSVQDWFKDLELVGVEPFKGTLALRQLLQATAPHTKSKPFGDGDRIHPSLGPRLMESALNGKVALPESVLLGCINRIRAEASLDSHNKEEVLSRRVALLKAYLNRIYRREGLQKEIAVSLDPANANQGYVLGRLFAVLERTQLASNNYKEVNSGIRDRFYGAFSSSPVTTYPLLMKLKNHHLKKMERQGEVVKFERLIGEIVDLLPPQGPQPHLSMADQARFAIGYYHQRQAFFIKTGIPETTQA